MVVQPFVQNIALLICSNVILQKMRQEAVEVPSDCHPTTKQRDIVRLSVA